MLKIKIKMNIKYLTVITILFLCCIFGFEETSYSLNKGNQNDISELKILKYLPKDNKKFFISNTKSSKITNAIRTNFETTNQDELVLVKNSILAYLGLDLGTYKLEDIYNNELLITTHDNKEKEIDDVLIIFKIKENKDIDDILNLPNKIDEPDKLIKIFRENKLNYLKYIYRTNDNYIITSSNKTLILDALQSINIENKYISLKEVLNNFKNEHNIFLTNNFKTNELLNTKNYSLRKEDSLLTLFDFKDKEIILKSYLVNNNKISDIILYKNMDTVNILDKKNYQLSIYNDLLDSNKYLDNIEINSFEKAIIKELNNKLKSNILFLSSDNNWLVIYDKNYLPIENIKLLEDFNKNSLENNNNIYTIYSKDVLLKEENIIKQLNYKKIFLVETDNLNFISNTLVNETDIDSISNEFFSLRGDSHAKYFLNKKLNLKNPYSIQTKNFSYLENINYFFKNIINLSITEFKAVIKQSIPETAPFYYAETNFKIFNN
ncbi:hypothetical protein PROCH_0256 [Prochlorococcus marinus str. EQPAC1]|nr:hypothetical protein PROCH_0256 [Prochlorococcus marinus str. EQPAC1]